MLGQPDEVEGRDVFWAFDHAVDVMTVCLVLLTNDEHGQLMSVALEACTEDS